MGGRFPPESAAEIIRNGWPTSSGMGGRHHRNTHLRPISLKPIWILQLNEVKCKIEIQFMRTRNALFHLLSPGHTGHTGHKMKNCDKCKKAVPDGEEKIFAEKIICDDCYIDKIAPKPGMKWTENDSAEFMRRMKTTFSVRRQKNQEFPDFREE